MTPEELQRFLDEAKESLDHFQANLKDAVYSQWNALLTFNGILIGAFSILAALDKVNKLAAILVLMASVVSSILLLLNFRSVVNFQNELLKKVTEKIQSVLNSDPSKFDERKKQSAWRYRRTSVAQWLLIIEAVSLFLIVYFSKYPSQWAWLVAKVFCTHPS